MNARIIGPLAPPGPGLDHSRTIPAGEAFAPHLSLAEVVAHRGNEPPLHRHRHEDVLVFILAGELTFHIDGAPVAVAAGSCVLLPRGTEHGYTIESPRAHFLVILTPAGAERFVAGLHDAGPAGAPGAGDGAGEAVERLITTAARYGIDITGPLPARA